MRNIKSTRYRANVKAFYDALSISLNELNLPNYSQSRIRGIANKSIILQTQVHKPATGLLGLNRDGETLSLEFRKNVFRDYDRECEMSASYTYSNKKVSAEGRFINGASDFGRMKSYFDVLAAFSMIERDIIVASVKEHLNLPPMLPL